MHIGSFSFPLIWLKSPGCLYVFSGFFCVFVFFPSLKCHIVNVFISSISPSSFFQARWDYCQNKTVAVGGNGRRHVCNVSTIASCVCKLGRNMLTLWEFGLRCVSLTWHLANGPRLQWAYELSSLVILQPKGALLLLQCGWSCLRITSWPTGLFWYRLGPWWLVLQVVEQQFGTWSTLLSVLRLFWELWSDSWIQMKMKTSSNVFF